jgi:hypothetical protein
MRRVFGYLPLLVVALAGCRRCGAKPAPPLAVEDLLPATTPGLVRVPSLSQLAGDAQALAKSLARLPEGEQVQRILEGVVGQLGFDPRTADGLKSAGLDGARPAAVMSEGGGLVAVLPVSDRGRFEKAVARLAQDRLGAGPGAAQGAATVFRGKSGTVALGFRGDCAVVASGPQAADAVGRALARTPADGLAQLPLYRLSMQKLGPGPDVVLWAPAGSALLPTQQLPGRAFALGISFHESRLQARLIQTLAVSEGIALAGLSLPAGQDLVGDLPPGTPLALRIGGDPAMLTGAWERLPASARAPFEDAGVNVPAEVLQNLMPGVVLGVGVAPNIDLSARPSFDPRAQNPFRYVTLDAFARVRDPVRAAATLEKIYAAATKLGTTVARRKAGAQEVAIFSYDQGESASVALVGKTLVVTGGEGEMQAALARLDGKSSRYAVPKGLERPLKGHVSAGATLDTDALREAVAGIPSTAYSGLTGLTVHALISRFLEPLALVGPIAATVDFDADAVTWEAGVSLR